MKPFKSWNCSRKGLGIRNPKISPHGEALAPIRNGKCLIPGVGGTGAYIDWCIDSMSCNDN